MTLFLIRQPMTQGRFDKNKIQTIMKPEEAAAPFLSGKPEHVANNNEYWA